MKIMKIMKINIKTILLVAATLVATSSLWVTPTAWALPRLLTQPIEVVYDRPDGPNGPYNMELTQPTDLTGTLANQTPLVSGAQNPNYEPVSFPNAMNFWRAGDDTVPLLGSFVISYKAGLGGYKVQGTYTIQVIHDSSNPTDYSTFVPFSVMQWNGSTHNFGCNFQVTNDPSLAKAGIPRPEIHITCGQNW